MVSSLVRVLSRSLKLFFLSRLGFCTLAALLMVILRLTSFDHHAFFEMQSIPNHDMYQGAAFFATNMHSIRLNGDIVWWNPISFHNGYAQYYQSFFSPLAPTSHHIVFIIWAQCIYILSLFNIKIPEYFQYLIINYIVFEFLTFLAFSLFTSFIFRYRSTVLLVLIVYVFSGIGLWNSAWFYFQESFSLFFLLAALIGTLQKPSLRRMALVLSAIVIQLTSINYWTIYNCWFLIILMGAYCCIYTAQVKRLYVRIKEMIIQHKLLATIVITWLVLVISIWILLIGSIVVEQSGNYIRASVGTQGGYSVMEAYSRVGGGFAQFMATQLFNPIIPQSNQPINLVHQTRYVGAFLIPFLMLIPAYRWGRREKWLIASTFGVLLVCIAPPFLLSAWELFPFMNRIIHLFYFYTHFWQIMIILVAGLAMEVLLWHNYSLPVKLRFIIVTSGTIVIVVASLLVHIQVNPRFAILLLFPSIGILQTLLFQTANNRKFLVFLVLSLALTDLTNYFWQISLIDQKFTASEARAFDVSVPLASEVQSAFRKSWPPIDSKNGFEVDLFKNMPVVNSFWPRNGYMIHKWGYESEKIPEQFKREAIYGASIEFYKIAEMATEQTDLEVIKDKLNYPKILILQSSQSQNFPDTYSSNNQANEISQMFNYEWREWRYNTFSFEVNAPQNGWLLIRQLYDPLWKLTIDGQPVQAIRANFFGMALPVTTGHHLIRMDYRPLARSLYWPASLLLEVTLLVLMIISLRCSTPLSFNLREKQK